MQILDWKVLYPFLRIKCNYSIEIIDSVKKGVEKKELANSSKIKEFEGLIVGFR